MIILILLLQIVPLLLFPAEVFAPGSQQWWLPAILVLMVLVADFAVVVRRSTSPWPWVLMSLAQGLNIISRLMLMWSQGSDVVNDSAVIDWPYIIMTLVAIALSAFMLSYAERPQVRGGLLHAAEPAASL